MDIKARLFLPWIIIGSFRKARFEMKKARWRKWLYQEESASLERVIQGKYNEGVLFVPSLAYAVWMASRGSRDWDELGRGYSV